MIFIVFHLNLSFIEFCQMNSLAGLLCAVCLALPISQCDQGMHIGRENTEYLAHFED